ncbi:dolichyl-phosphate beta-glucosyltransferase [Geobacter sp. AOG2]|uniref:dolichyl-phosphate beta-glucosyltransferase n=1 Tax=Geobacter sp. AOG2 TaxID=1566347 RepID=UPI001CC6F62C|nr:dolichyl-phosphate beta-glucosyltransferase [Geobacter sp. AOG2]GFE62158.1 glycosyl transferase [Geobacter sp. AOG2]
MNSVSLSIIIPAYNEEKRLPPYLASVLEYLEHGDRPYEVIIVDDGSHDATAEVVARFMQENTRVKLIRLPGNRGKGYAVKTGMLRASGNLRLFTDADGATPITELERLQKAIADGADVAIASRAMKDDSCLVNAHLHRKVIGRIFHFIVTALMVQGIRDTQCGFKLFTADAAETVFSLQRIDDFGFDVEALYLCKHNDYRIAEVPVNWTDIAGSKVSLVRDSLRMFTDIFRIRFFDLTGAYRH